MDGMDDLLRDDEDPEEPDTRWDGYSDYAAVSRSVALSVDNAIEAYTRLDSLHMENAKVDPAVAAEARSHILAAAMKLVPEMQQDRENVDLYDEILGRWLDGGAEDEGYLHRMHETQLQRGSPGWLSQFVLDIRSAGFELGYLKAGRQERIVDEHTAEAQANAMVK